MASTPTAIYSLPLVWIGLIFLGAFLYFLPSLVARLNHKANVWAIFAFNLLLGWTMIGWITSLVWALTKDKKESLATSAVNVVTRVEEHQMYQRRSLKDLHGEDLGAALQPAQPPPIPVQNKTRICKACKFEIRADADKCGHCRAMQPRLIWRLSILTLIFTALLAWRMSHPALNELAKDADKANTTLADKSNYAPTTPAPSEERTGLLEQVPSQGKESHSSMADVVLGFKGGESISDASKRITELGFAGDCTQRQDAPGYTDCKFGAQSGSMDVSFYDSQLQRIAYRFGVGKYDEVLQDITKIHGAPQVLSDPQDSSLELRKEWGGVGDRFSISLTTPHRGDFSAEAEFVYNAPGPAKY